MHQLQQRRKTSEQTLSSHKNYVQSVADGFYRISKLDYIGLILVDPRVKINEICYCGVFLPQQLLPAIRQVSVEFSKTVPSVQFTLVF